MADKTLEELQQEYRDLMHAMQTGVAYTIEFSPKETEPKHLRVGINSALSSNGSLAKLLIDKGILTEQEVWEYMVEGMKKEVQSYQDKLQGRWPYVSIDLV